MRNPSVMQHQFSQVPQATMPRSSFDLSHGYKTTFDADYLIPVGVWDVSPGDSWNVKSTIVARLATPIHPLMDNLYIDYFAFFVPYRILWNNWEKFMGAQDDPADSIDYTVPVVSGNATETGEGSIWDYFGLPLDDGNGAHIDPDDVVVSALPFRAYSLIRDQWFRDENLQDSVYLGRSDQGDDGPDILQNISSTATGSVRSRLLKRCKKHDYFTSALPWPQKGDAVDLPLGTSAPIYTVNTTTLTDEVYGIGNSATQSGKPNAASTYLRRDTSQDAAIGGQPVTLFADLTSATAATINDYRLAMQTQALLERDARSGTRYVETLKAHWGVTFPDYTAQRPVYLGGGTTQVGITPVPQTTYESTPTVENAKGNLAGFGTAADSHGFTKSFVEHGLIMVLVNGRGDITYSQGIDRYWSKQTRYDFLYPILSGIGEQAINVGEIYVDTTAGTTEDVFGYTGRYNEYRFLNSKNTNLMNPQAASTLASWNLQEEFSSEPTLGNTFIESETGTPLDRAIAVTTEPHFICDIYHDIKCARTLPLYGNPSSLTHF